MFSITPSSLYVACWKLIQVCAQAVTAFPILFAVVIGRMTRAIATYLLERGVSLGVLEQLSRSSTLGNTILNYFLIRTYNLVGVGLLILWALSPLGGQSTLHIISTTREPFVSSANVSYLNALNTQLNSPFSIGADFASILPQLNSIYSSSLMAPESVKRSPRDQWQNIKIPSTSRSKPKISPNSTGWIDIKSYDDVRYTSLTGIPFVSPGDKVANTSFRMESSYFDIDCFNITSKQGSIPLAPYIYGKATDDSLAVKKLENQTFNGSNGTGTCKTAGCALSFGIGMDSLVTNYNYGNISIFPNVTGNDKYFTKERPVMLFESRYWESNDPLSSIAYCHIDQIYVESEVTCVGDGLTSVPYCSVTAMRDSLLPHPAKDVTPFLFGNLLYNFADSLATSSGFGHAATYTPTEKFLMDSTRPLSVTSAPLFQVPPDIFSERLTQVVNTYYYASLHTEGMTGNVLAGLEDAHTRDPFGTHIRSTSGIVTGWSPFRYKINPGWMVVFVISTVAMLLGALLTSFALYRTNIPDIIGYVSTMTRDSKQSCFPPGGSAIDGSERARLLRNLHVRLGDVKADNEESGYLAFTALDLAQRAKKTRYYD